MKVETIERIYWAGVGAIVFGMITSNALGDMADTILFVGFIISMVAGGISIYKRKKGKENK